MRSCPIPITEYPEITLAHGGGGKLTHQLIEKMFIPVFGNEHLRKRLDSAVLDVPKGMIAFTTDSYVVKPLFFPGGDIGSLAVYGTINDLAMCGARPLYMSVGFIIEEGFPMETLWRIVRSMKEAADSVSVQLVTGDTKVVDKGKGDGIFINTSGVGAVQHKLNLSPESIRPGDKILLNGDLGRHGITVMASREGLSFETSVKSDLAPLWSLVKKLLDSNIEIRILRDLTRGGLASSLNEIAVSGKINFYIDEQEIRVVSAVEGACEMLGLDPLYVANEGRCIVFVPPGQAEKAREVMGPETRVIGEVQNDRDGLVTLKNKIGTTRILDMITGEQLPRIC